MKKPLLCICLFSVTSLLVVTQNVTAATVVVSSYVYDGAGAGATPTSFPDTGGIELTNGLFPGSTAFTDAAWVGFADGGLSGTTSHPQVTFDFGSSQTVNTIDVTYLHSTTQAGGTITAPESVLISVSNDNISYSAATSFSTEFDSLGGDAIRTANIDVSALANAQYYRLDFRNSSHWTFLSEVEFKSDTPEPPEPPQTEKIGVTSNTAGSRPGLPFSLGYVFDVDEDINVTSLGQFDVAGNGVVETAKIAIFNWDTGVKITETTLAGAALEETGFYDTHFVDITPVTLETGTNYLIAVEVEASDFANGNGIVTLDSTINWQEGRATGVGAPAMPAIGTTGTFSIQRNSDQAYFGPNLKFEAVPEPTSIFLLGLGSLLALAFNLRRRRIVK